MHTAFTGTFRVGRILDTKWRAAIDREEAAPIPEGLHMLAKYVQRDKYSHVPRYQSSSTTCPARSKPKYRTMTTAAVPKKFGRRAEPAIVYAFISSVKFVDNHRVKRVARVQSRSAAPLLPCCVGATSALLLHLLHSRFVVLQPAGACPYPPWNSNVQSAWRLK